MEQIHYSYSVSVEVKLTREDIAHVIEIGKHHYDLACNTLSKSWQFILDCILQEGKKEEEFLLDSRELGIVCKIMEQEHCLGGNDSEKWWNIQKKLSNEYQRVNSHWMIKDTETFTQYYRDELTAKFGDGKVTIPE